MKILISAGIRTNNIVDAINKKFNSGGIDFIVVPFIEEIDYIYQRGEYFDRAILLEQCWNHDFEDMDEMSVRSRINNFANQSLNRDLTGVSFIFLAQEDETAAQVYEEILPIQTNSIVLVKQPRYSVPFFGSLITTELDKMHPDLVYTPDFEDEINQPNQVVEEVIPELQYTPDYDTDIGSEIIPGSDEIWDGNNLAPSEMLPDSYGFNKTESDDEFEDFGNNEIDNGFDDEIPVEDSDMGDGFEDDWGDSGDNISEPEYIHESAPIDTSDFNPNLGGINLNKEPEIDVDMGDSFDEPVQEQPRIRANIVKEREVEMDNSRQSGEIPDYSGDDTGYMGYIPEPEPEPVMNQGMGADQYNPSFDNEYGNQQEPQYEEPSMYDNMNNGMGAAMGAGMAAGMGMDDSDYYNPPQEQYNPDYDSYNQRSPGFSGGFSDDDYAGERDVTAPIKKQGKRIDLSNAQIKATLDAFANRGSSILVTGCGGCGTSTIALNLANIINNLGYTVLLVDLDTKNKAQSYISSDNYDSMEPESAGLMAAVNSTSGINTHVAIVRQGFHLLTMGMASDAAPIDKLLQKEKIARFMNLAKTNHNFVIYDVPFETAVGFGKDFTFMADNIVMTVDCSNWGVTKTMLSMCNIDTDDMQETLFNKGQILFNRYRALNRIMGRKVKTAIDITKVMDYKVRELLGEDPGFYFQSMHICGLLNEDHKFESGWYEEVQYSDTREGGKIFLELLKNIVLKR